MARAVGTSLLIAAMVAGAFFLGVYGLVWARSQVSLDRASIARKVSSITRSKGVVELDIAVGDILRPQRIDPHLAFDVVVASAPLNRLTMTYEYVAVTNLAANILCGISSVQPGFLALDDRQMLAVAQSIVDRNPNIVQEFGRDRAVRLAVGRALALRTFHCIQQLEGTEYDRLYRTAMFDLDGQDRAKPKFLPLGHTRFFAEERIRIAVLLGLFSPVGHGTGELAEQVAQGVSLALDGLSTRTVGQALLVGPNDNQSELALRDLVTTVAIAALAGTEGRPDSGNYLTFRRSFEAVLEGIRSAQLEAVPTLRRIVLVVYIGDAKRDAALLGARLALVAHIIGTSSTARTLPVAASLFIGFLLYGLRRGTKARSAHWLFRLVDVLLVLGAALGTMPVMEVSGVPESLTGQVFMLWALGIVAFAAGAWVDELTAKVERAQAARRGDTGY